MKLKKLYFKHSDGNVECLCEVKEDESAACYIAAALNDLHVRNPRYKSYYQRVWTDDSGWIHIDVGSWSEEYIVKDD